MIMNENQSYSLQDSECFGKDDESPNFVSKEIYGLDKSSRESHDISEVRGKDEFKNHKVVDELPLDSSDRTMNSVRNEDQNGFSHHSRDQGKGDDLLSFNTYSHDELKRSHLVAVEEDAHFNGNEARDSGILLFEEDKNGPHRDAPELEVCCKEIDLHVVKDICVDEGRPEKGRMLLESSEDDKSDHVFPRHLKNDSDCKAKEECKAQEMALSDKNNDFRANFGAAEKSATPLVGRKPPVDEFMTPNVGECLVVSLDGEEKVKPQPDQIAHGKAASQNRDVKLADEEQPTDSGDAHEHNDSKLDNHSADDQVGSPGDTSRSSMNEDAETVEPGVPRISNNVSAMARLQHDEGETSFSAASLINYSEPVPFSGSLSHRSDASTTSARSFAFPVLQNEWNSSPVRMAKADRRHLRKQKFWRSGLFCCKF